MRPSRRVLKIAAVVCSFSLIGLYVYDRAGGNLIQRIYPGVAPENERPMMSSSKLKQMFKAVEMHRQNQSANPQLLPGSKSTLVVPGTHPQSEESPPAETAPARVMLHGSKSMAPLIPVPTPQEADRQLVPNGPAQEIPLQQGQQSAKPTRNNSGRR